MKLNESQTVVAVRKELHFDRACEEAHKLAAIKMGIDEDGYCQNVEGWCRSTDRIEVNFLGLQSTFTQIGVEHKYTFSVVAVRGEDDEPEEDLLPPAKHFLIDNVPYRCPCSCGAYVVKNGKYLCHNCGKEFRPFVCPTCGAPPPPYHEAKVTEMHVSCKCLGLSHRDDCPFHVIPL